MKGETKENNRFYINGINYSYSLSKSDKDQESLVIKLIFISKNNNKK